MFQQQFRDRIVLSGDRGSMCLRLLQSRSFPATVVGSIWLSLEEHAHAGWQSCADRYN